MERTAMHILEIIWLSNLSILNIPEVGYSRNASCALILISTFLLDKFISCCVTQEVTQ